MEKIKIVNTLVLVLLLAFYSCSNGQEQSDSNDLSPKEFSKKAKAAPSSSIIDVRTPEEFSKGHIENAKNIDWNGAEFESSIVEFDKEVPIFVYCLSGGRSGSAAEKMRSIGFKKVYELKGGISKWRGDGLPETTNMLNKTGGISGAQFDSLLTTDKLVLVNFYARWCAPCKLMGPYLEEIKNEKESSVVVVRIDSDDNQLLYNALKLDALPMLLLYKNKKVIWSKEGFISKDEVVKQLK